MIIERHGAARLLAILGDIVTGGLIVCTGALDLYVRWAGDAQPAIFHMQRGD